MRLLATLCALALTLATSLAEHEGKLQILLLGDSLTEAEIPRLLAPREPQFEDIITNLLTAEGDLPPARVINLGEGGEFIRRLLDSGRYAQKVSKLPGLDYIFIRYGVNDRARREGFDENFPKDYAELLAKLRQDHPKALLIPMTVIPFSNEGISARINGLVRQVGTNEKLEVFDIYPRYAEELKQGPNMLNYRQYDLKEIPEKLRGFAQPYIVPGRPGQVIVMDNRLDAHFGKLPGWFSERHCNLAGYHVIADETVKYLAPIIRRRLAKAN